MGFEFEAFAKGTFDIADTLPELTGSGCTTIIGGGDSVAAFEKAGLADKMSHISTGGGASRVARGQGAAWRRRAAGGVSSPQRTFGFEHVVPACGLVFMLTIVDARSRSAVGVASGSVLGACVE